MAVTYSDQIKIVSSELHQRITEVEEELAEVIETYLELYELPGLLPDEGCAFRCRKAAEETNGSVLQSNQ